MRMRIDSHQHFWHYDPVQYDWIDDSMAAIRRDFLPQDLAPILEAGGLDGAVAVQARQTLAETYWLLDLAKRHAFIKAVVGWVPLAAPDVVDHLDRLASHPKLRGIRHVVQGEPDPAFLDGPAFNAGVRDVTAHDLAYDLLVLTHQLPAAIAFVDRHPNQRFALDHIAKPRVEGAPPAEWRRLIGELARREHVACKFSGVVTEVPGRQWTAGLIQPYFDVALEAFGPRRLMFGSDWPVCLVASDHARWLECVATCAAALSAGERARLFGDTAAGFYRLSP